MYQNAAVTFLKTQISTDIIILNSTLKTGFSELLKCTHPHTHTLRLMYRKKKVLL